MRYYEQNIDVNTVIVPDEEAVKIFDYYRVEPLFEDIWAVNGTLVNDIGLKDEKICKSEVFIRTYNYEYFLVMMSKLGRINRKFISPFLEDRFLYVKELRSGKQSARSTELPKRWHHGGPCIPGEKALFLSADGYYYPCERVNETSSLARIGSISTGIDIGKVKDVINIEKYTAEECRNCWAYRYCTVCVRNICIDNHNIKDAIIESCSGIKLLVEEAFKDYREYSTMNGKYTLYEIDTPIILVIGISKELNDFSQLQAMKQKLEEEGYASLIMSDYSDKFDDDEIVDMSLLTSAETIIEKAINMNHYAKHLEITKKVDTFVVGASTGVSSFGKNIVEDFGISAYVISKALPPDCIVLNSFYSEYGETTIAGISAEIESFLGENIDVLNILPKTIDFARSESEGRIISVNMNIEKTKKEVQSWDAQNFCFSEKSDDVDEVVEKCCEILKAYSEIELI